MLVTGTVAGVLISNPVLKTPRWRKVKVGAFVIFGASSFIPLLHGTQRYGHEYMFQHSGMKWYLLELTLYGTGVSLYTVCLHAHRVPFLEYASMYTRILTNIYSSEFRSNLRRVSVTFGEVRTRSFMSLSYAQCTHIRLHYCKVLQPVIHWMCVSFRVFLEQDEPVPMAGLHSIQHVPSIEYSHDQNVIQIGYGSYYSSMVVYMDGKVKKDNPHGHSRTSMIERHEDELVDRTQCPSHRM